MTTMSIDDINTENRVRRDMGDIAGLSKSIEQHGLLHPVVVKNDGTLVAGHRRIEAAKRLGWKDIPVTRIDVADLLQAERDENAERKDFTPSEAVAIGRLIEEQERPNAIEAKRRGGQIALAKRRGLDGRDSPSSVARGSVAEIAAQAVGMSEQKYRYARQVLTAAESDPEKFGDLPAKMDETGNVYGTHREMERRKAGDFSGDKRRNGLRSDKEARYVPDTKRKRDLAEGQKSRMVRSLSIVTGHCRGLEGLDVQMALAVCSKEEIEEWAGKAREAGRAFFQLARKLQKGNAHDN